MARASFRLNGRASSIAAAASLGTNFAFIGLALFRLAAQGGRPATPTLLPGFRGGKGMATTAGVFALLDFHPFLKEPVHIRLLKDIALAADNAKITLLLIGHRLELRVLRGLRLGRRPRGSARGHRTVPRLEAEAEARLLVLVAERAGAQLVRHVLVERGGTEGGEQRRRQRVAA